MRISFNKRQKYYRFSFMVMKTSSKLVAVSFRWFLRGGQWDWKEKNWPKLHAFLLTEGINIKFTTFLQIYPYTKTVWPDRKKYNSLENLSKNEQKIGSGVSKSRISQLQIYKISGQCCQIKMMTRCEVVRKIYPTA